MGGRQDKEDVPLVAQVGADIVEVLPLPGHHAAEFLAAKLVYTQRPGNALPTRRAWGSPFTWGAVIENQDRSIYCITNE